MTAVNNKRIAKNTAFLYLRMLIVMTISIYTVRVVLENLGIIDYGIFNVVGGLSGSLIFFHTALTNATQRFLNYELGTNNIIRLGQIFNISLEIYSLIGIIILFAGSIIGFWFISYKLVIPPDKITAAYLVFAFTLISLVFSFISAVYESVLIARENMKIYAYLGLFDAIAKLIVAYFIIIISSNKLIAYSVLLALCTIIPKLIMMHYCKRNYSETKLKFYWDKTLFKEIFGFSGWNFYGTAAWMINQQGINILLNMFFGPTVNAARGVAYQVTGVVTNFATNFFTAVRPQIVKTYASNELGSFLKLIFLSSKFSCYLILLFLIPIYFRVDYLLDIWLKDVPEYTAIFIRWVLVYMLVENLNNPLWTAIQAVGNIRNTMIYGSTFFLLAFPISYIFLRIGYQPWIVYPVLILIRIGYLFIVFHIFQNYVPISGKKYLKDVVVPVLVVMIISYSAIYQINSLFPQTFFALILISIISLIVISGVILIFGISRQERYAFIIQLKNVIIKIKTKYLT